MSTPRYFSQFPNIQYALKVNKAGQSSFINIKDYFHLLTPRNDIYREDTLYNKYVVHDGMRPDEVSYAVYGDEQFYWVVLQINQIVDYYSQWPLSEVELTDYVYKKYGGAAGAGQTHHFETVPVYDQATPPNRILPGGLVVPPNYIFRYPPTPGASQSLFSTPISVSNYQYERKLNDKKSEISILDPSYIYDYAREVRTYANNLGIQISFEDKEAASLAY